MAAVLMGVPRLASPQPNGPLEEPRHSITVETFGGRRFRGEVDARSDREHLWLRTTRGESSILRPIRWERIDRVELEEEQYAGEEFLAAFLAMTAVTPPAAAAPPSTIRMVGNPDENFSPAPRPSGPGRRASSEAVRSLGIDVGVANWDDDVEADGLLVEIQPLDARGSMTPANGTLWVDLIGRTTGPVNRPEPPIRLGRWSQPVLVEDFGPSGAVYRLPFQAIHPAFELGIAPDSLVHVRLSVPGQGVFTASDCPWRLRPYCPFRDELYQATGHSFLPLEWTGRGRKNR